MEKDDPYATRVFSTNTSEALRALRNEAQLQTMSALLLTLIALMMTIVGIVSVLMKLSRILNYSFLLMIQRVIMRRLKTSERRLKTSEVALEKLKMNEGLDRIYRIQKPELPDLKKRFYVLEHRSVKRTRKATSLKAR